jgi:hypothetical protein
VQKEAELEQAVLLVVVLLVVVSLVEASRRLEAANTGRR